MAFTASLSPARSDSGATLAEVATDPQLVAPPAIPEGAAICMVIICPADAIHASALATTSCALILGVAPGPWVIGPWGCPGAVSGACPVGGCSVAVSGGASA